MFNRRIAYIFFITFWVLSTHAQDCYFSISGKVTDQSTKLPLSYVNVIVQELSVGNMTDDNGDFKINNICEGHYHLIVSHLGCESVEIHLDLEKDTTLYISLNHSAISLESVVVEGSGSNLENQPTVAINKQLIEDNSNKNLSSLLENESGVQILRNGTAIAKPVVHGMYGNRLTILNNGVAQAGQQWGNDHSPEIDPMIASKITVLKGTNAIEYGGGNMGSIVLIEPKPIGRDPHLHGGVNYLYESNGRGSNVNFGLQQYSDKLAWRFNGTFKKYGDRKSASYFLNNTGSQEANLAIQLEKSWNEKLFIDLYASTFNTTLGVLRGSHIGNITDLIDALERDEPFFTESVFSSEIEAPKQQVSHHLVKWNTKYYFNDNTSLKFVLAGQLNQRKEFDVRRSGRTDIPALSLKQYTLNADITYAKIIGYDWNLKLGSQNIFTDNTNNPETGILPLIPDYFSAKSGMFSTLSKQWNDVHFNTGLRYDFELQNVVSISQSVPREIVRYQNKFNNLSAMVGLQYNLSTSQSLTFNSGYAMRNPAINELYSNGLHQGVSGIEEGDKNLKTEKGIKSTLEYKLISNTNLSFSSLFYYQRFSDYIFLNPQEEVRLTIRGAFPVFKYEQTNAEIYGLDLSTQFSIQKNISGLVRYSYIKGQDVTNNLPLVNIPTNSIYTSFTYRHNSTLKLSTLVFEDFEFEVNHKYVFKQNNLLESQDFVSPPEAYNLVGMKISSNIILKNYKLRLIAKVDNLFNVSFRDYLNRQRYFANDLGISASFGLSLKF